MTLFCDKKVFLFFFLFLFVNDVRASFVSNAGAKYKQEQDLGIKLVDTCIDFVKRTEPLKMMFVYFATQVMASGVQIVLFCIDKFLNYFDREQLSKLQEEENKILLDSVPEMYTHVPTEMDMTTFYEAFDSNFENIVEQYEAKEIIWDQFSTHLLKIKEHEMMNGPKRRGPGVEFYCLVGEPGLGKTQSSIALARSYCPGQEARRVFTIDASSLLNSSGEKKGVASLFCLVKKKRGEREYFVYSDFLALLLKTKYPVIIFNEIDKLLAEEVYQKDVSEFLRSILEEGTITTETGEVIDCSGLTIIFTSNNPDMFSDPSMKTRFNMIFFHNFSEEGYSLLFKRKFEKYLKNLNNFLSKESYPFYFKLSEKCCENVAKKVCSDNSLSSTGARCFSLFVNKMGGFLAREMRDFSNHKSVEAGSISGRVKVNKKGIVPGENIIEYRDGKFFFISPNKK